jgi:hypothetical protein
MLANSNAFVVIYLPREQRVSTRLPTKRCSQDFVTICKWRLSEVTDVTCVSWRDFLFIHELQCRYAFVCHRMPSGRQFRKSSLLSGRGCRGVKVVKVNLRLRPQRPPTGR